MQAEPHDHGRARRRPARPFGPSLPVRRPEPATAARERPPEPAWMEVARRRLQSLALADGPDESLESPNPFSTYAARRLLERLAEIDLQPDRLLPSLGGGIWLLFSGLGRRADIEIFNHGEIVATCAEEEGALFFRTLEPDGLRLALAELREFLRGPAS